MAKLDDQLFLIGGGNMGAALLDGVLRSRLVPAERVTVADVSDERRGELESRFGVKTIADPKTGIARATTVLLAVKPFVLTDVLDAIRDAVKPDQLFLSIVAGVESASIRDRLGKRNPVLRAMPNLAATVGASASALAGCEPATDEHFEWAEKILASVGTVVRVDESQIDAVTGLSGSGPAYVFTVIESLADGGVRMGLPRAVALRLATKTVLGAARLVEESGEHPAVLRDRVTTPAGTTASGLAELERGALRSVLARAVEAAARRATELRDS